MEYKRLSQNELNKIIENHQHFLHKDTENWADMRAKFSGVILDNLNLDGINLRNAEFEDVKLLNMYLLQTNLSQTSFKKHRN